MSAFNPESVVKKEAFCDGGLTFQKMIDIMERLG